MMMPIRVLKNSLSEVRMPAPKKKKKHLPNSKKARTIERSKSTIKVQTNVPKQADIPARAAEQVVAGSSTSPAKPVETFTYNYLSSELKRIGILSLVILIILIILSIILT